MSSLLSEESADLIEAPAVPSFREATKLWAKIGLLSFGGPAGQIALMHRELVEEKRWIGEQRFLHALNYCMLLPGPEAQQLAIYIGWLLHKTVGGLVAGVLFVVPGALVMLTLSILYALYGDAPLVDSLFFGVKAAVLAIVVEAVIRIGRRALKNRVMTAIALCAFVGIYVLNVPFPLLVLFAGLVGWVGNGIAPALFSGAAHGKDDAPDATGAVDLMFERGELAHTRPTRWHAPRTIAIWLPIWLGPVVLIWAFTSANSVWTQIGGFFSLMAVVTFGGAYAVLAYVAQAAVSSLGWLAPGEMVDGLGLAETTPGPLILVLQFVGFLAGLRHSGSPYPLFAGSLGALLTLWVTFTPCFFWIFLGAPYIEALRGNKALSAALGAITAAVVGVIMNLALWFALHVIFRDVRATGLGTEVPVLSSIDWRAALLSCATMIAILKLKIGMLPTLAGSALAGVLLLAASG
ncbi:MULTISPECIES: chromate efflux transporter [unclassified Mesorhizobium]|uniref:chromate efflux transporter n=1 Tax=unclassified Mesorhizobium TaxID=325217 RepID=UPI00112DB2D9|nr:MULTISPECIES: chromate efflux transporter [unclassified Mesorhizobium]MBZ9701037.1 chromate efflux transporter [Mesorhizobium sp. CO1-1-3]MBZ9895895.1 chromate efflux transporter [Mesorhizobium sp. BR1-1-6]MBZ9947689.1 chromate efflux transporter [Mesorhizobium sp. BR1-1-11]TPJ00688.1 chromate efflux transporter [Mesorhizobium sp. B2-8-1]